MNGDGTRQQQLTSVRDGACQPAWSPDGAQLAFISPCSGRKDLYPGSSIYFMNADGTNVHLLPLTPSIAGDFDPAWSPDGKKLAFTSLRNGRPQILVFDLTNSLLSILSTSNYPDKQPAWSPYGKQLAFVRQAPNGQIWTMDADGSHADIFSPAGGINNLWPVWSRDGQNILYSQTSVDVVNPWLIGRRYEDRGNARESRIPPDTGNNKGPIVKPDVSPDGMWIAYESWPLGVNHDIYIMSMTGANITRLTTDPAFDISPAWRPGPSTSRAIVITASGCLTGLASFFLCPDDASHPESSGVCGCIRCTAVDGWHNPRLPAFALPRRPALP